MYYLIVPYLTTEVIFFYSEKEIVLGVNLHEAAEKGYLPTVEYLVGEGASVDEMDSRGMLELIHCLY